MMDRNPEMANMALEGALQAGPGGPPPQGGPAGPPMGGPGGMESPMPGMPPELVAMAFELGLDIRNPEHLAILLKILGQGGGGPLGPMAGAGPGGAAGPGAPQEF